MDGQGAAPALSEPHIRAARSGESKGKLTTCIPQSTTLTATSSRRRSSRALGGDAALAKLGWEAPGTRRGARRSLGRRSSIAIGVVARGADRQRARRRGVGRARPSRAIPAGSSASSWSIRRAPMRSAQAAAAIDADGAARDLPVPGDASLLASRRAGARRSSTSPRRQPGTAVFVHCGVLSVGVRKKLGLPSPFDIRFGNPLDLHAVALRYPQVPIIIPHFGAGLFREALMVADLCPNVLLRHVELERLDQVPARPDARRRLPAGARRRRAGSAAVRHRFVVLPARMGEGRLRAAVRGARRDRRERGGARQDLRRELRRGSFPPSTKTHEERLDTCGSDRYQLSVDETHDDELSWSVLRGPRASRGLRPAQCATDLQVLAQQVAPEVAVEVAPHRVDVVAVVLGVVVLDQERRALDPVVVLLAALGLAGPREADLLDAGLLQPRQPSAAMSAAILPV